MKRALDTVNLLLMVGMMGFAALAWPHLPDRIPLHFGLDGQPDSWGEKSLLSWFGLPASAVALALLMGWIGRLLPRHPRWANLPDGRRLSDLPEVARGPVLRMMRGFLALVQTEILMIFALIEYATYRAAMGQPSQGTMILVLVLAVMMSPVLLVVFFLGYRSALE